jgi:copper transport protein
VKRLVVLVALASLVIPAAALAHATLLRTTPASGRVLASSPKQVTVSFDDTVRIGKGNAAVANTSGRSVLAGPPVARGHDLILPLRAHLPNGDYSVRWSIVSDDGHPERGVLAFGVGAGRGPPVVKLTASTHLGWTTVVERLLYLLGLLVAGGAAIFRLRMRSLLGRRLDVPLAQVIFGALLLSFLGASALLQSATPGTRYDHVLRIALVLAVAGGAAAALVPIYPLLLELATACSLALLVAPTLSGHALDPDQPRYLSVPADLAHVAAAAVWLGGLLSLLTVLPRITRGDDERGRVVRRFSTTALVTVGVLVLSGLARALTELDAVSQIWSTSYGRALVVKSALLLPLLGLGWLNRTQLLDSFARLRRSVSVEVVLLTGIVIAVAVLVQLRPGKALARRAAATPAAAAPKLPPANAVVDARAVGGLAVAIARVPGFATVTIVGPDGTGDNSERVSIDGRPAAQCGSGCYRARAGSGPVRVTVGGRTTTFAIPARAPTAAARMQAVTKRYRGARTIVFDETLSATGSGGQQTRFTAVAPHRLEYQIRGGPSAIVIGARRWDRDAAGKPYVESPQSPLDVTQPLWQSASNVHEVAPGVLTFLDRSLPAWFRLTLAGPLPRSLRMTAAAHFMTERYVGFDVPAVVSPPSR